MENIELKNNNAEYQKYLEDYKKFYGLKKKYTDNIEIIKKKIINTDNSLDVKKKLLSKQINKCINCGKSGGTIFFEDDKVLKATCGNADNSCKLNLEVKKITVSNLFIELENLDLQLNNLKKNIIVTKLDYLFNYIDENKAIETFDNLKIELNKYQEKYNTTLSVYYSVVNNIEINNLINSKLLEHHNLINEYKEYINLFQNLSEKKYLNDAIDLYLSKIKLLDKDIMKIKYKHNYIEKFNDTDTIKLVQEKYNINDIEIVNK